MGHDKHHLTLIQSKLYRHLPASIQVYNSLALALSEDGIERTVVTKISDLPDRCSVVMFNLAESPKVVISMFCTDEAEDDLRKILLDNISWNVKINFAGLNEKYLQIVEGLVTQEVQRKWIYENPSSQMWYSDQGEEMPGSLSTCRLDCPSLSVQPLHCRHAALLSSTWKFSSDSTEQLVSVLAKLGRVLGVFSDGETEPIAWMMIYSHGTAGMLKTREGFRNRGIASFLLKAVTEKMLSLGLVPCVQIEENNVVSQRFFRKHGFVSSELAQWVTHNPV